MLSLHLGTYFPPYFPPLNNKTIFAKTARRAKLKYENFILFRPRTQTHSFTKRFVQKLLLGMLLYYFCCFFSYGFDDHHHELKRIL